MGKRRDGREAAIQFLYQLDLNRENPAELFESFWVLRTGPGNEAASKKTRAFTEQIVAGVRAHAEEIDEQIKKFAANYDLHRIAPVDRNILRLAIYEMLFCADVPPVVSINEAIEIAKKFGGDESGRFVNGILDRVRGELKRDARAAIRPGQ
ncbi:MAG: nusB [Chthoniobacteraceae bacterium]|nr:nusB [Chthoniobacteraceae bacterium]